MRVFHVSELIEALNVLFREACAEEEVAVEGEISGYRVSQGQWVTFDLKDEQALLNVFLPVWNLHLPLENGMRVRVLGFPRIYPKYGKFSLSASRVESIGEGSIKKALLMLRARLEGEGLFDPSRKRALPRFPNRVALITSRESAAYGDFCRILEERWKGIEVDVYHVLVQGDRAPQEVVQALEAVQREKYDVVILTRGGGSFEELMAFNDERVVRAIYASRIPTLVAIGHERDLTLAEEAADVRGSTPTDCARRLVPDRQDIQYEIAALIEKIESAFERNVHHQRNVVQRALSAPGLWLAVQRTTARDRVHRCFESTDRWMATLRERTESHLRLLGSYDPEQVLKRGYALVRGFGGDLKDSTTRIALGEDLEIRFWDGCVHVQATKQLQNVDGESGM
jgi:exodeoxyribonuclease VII large subunit